MTARRRRLVADIAARCPCRPNRFWRSDVRSVWLQNVIVKLHVFDAWVIAFPAHALLFQGSTHLWITSATHASDSVRCGARFRRHWGRDSVPSGARLRQVGHDSATVRKVPHFPAESCPTSQRNAAPLQTESVPHFHG